MSTAEMKDSLKQKLERIRQAATLIQGFMGKPGEE